MFGSKGRASNLLPISCPDDGSLDGRLEAPDAKMDGWLRRWKAVEFVRLEEPPGGEIKQL